MEQSRQSISHYAPLLKAWKMHARQIIEQGTTFFATILLLIISLTK